MKSSLFAVGIVVGGITLFSADYAIGSSIKPPGGRTGSPVDGGKTCMDNCHVGSVTAVSEGISTNIPSDGYVGGETYTITVGSGVQVQGVGTYGFQFSAQDSLGNQMGELNSIAYGGTINYIPKKYISHSSPQQTSNPSWTFEWKAPVPGSGIVNFYAALVAANGNASNSGDAVLTTNASIEENYALSAKGFHRDNFIQAAVVKEKLIIHYQNNVTNSFLLELHDLEGKLVHKENVVLEKGSGSKMTKLQHAVYSSILLLNLRKGNENISMKIIAH